MTVSGHAWVLEAMGEPLARRERQWQTPADGFALLQVLGCGVCHTDLGFADGPVRTKGGAPIVLGHEIVGRVLEVGPQRRELVGRRVLAPAVSSCGRCATCRRGRPTACPDGRMPGNDDDGGFATHCYVPARDLQPLDEEPGRQGPVGAAELEPWQLAPVADAATTAWQAIVRAGLQSGDVAVFVGAGGVGGFGVQLARSEGAFVIAIDVDRRRLDALAPFSDEVVEVGEQEPRALRKVVRETVARAGKGDAPVRVFETSGTPGGQALAFRLLERGGSLSVVGFTPEKLPLRLSNIMALDVDVHGNWGCDPALYPSLLERVLDGRVRVADFVESHPLDSANEVLARLRDHELERRAVLVPGEEAS